VAEKPATPVPPAPAVAEKPATPVPPAPAVAEKPATPVPPKKELKEIDTKLLKDGKINDELVLKEILQDLGDKDGKPLSIPNPEAKNLEKAIKGGNEEQAKKAAEEALKAATAYDQQIANLRNAARMLRDKNSSNDKDALEIIATEVKGLEKTEKILATKDVEFVKSNLSDKIYKAADKLKDGEELDIKKLDESIRQAAEPGSKAKKIEK
jgi:hypothetical protein